MSIFEQPIGTAADPVFAFQDLLDVDREFSTSGAYFGNERHDIVCIQSPYDWRDEICAPKAIEWQPATYVSSIDLPCAVSTSEPAYTLGAVMVVLVVLKAVLWLRREGFFV